MPFLIPLAFVATIAAYIALHKPGTSLANYGPTGKFNAAYALARWKSVALDIAKGGTPQQKQLFSRDYPAAMTLLSSNPTPKQVADSIAILNGYVQMPLKKPVAKTSVPKPDAKAWKEIQSPFLLTPGSQYRAAIMLHGLEPLASNNMIAEKLIKAGFARVKVTGSGGTRIGTGVYRGDGKPRQMASIDKHITRVWRWS